LFVYDFGKPFFATFLKLSAAEFNFFSATGFIFGACLVSATAGAGAGVLAGMATAFVGSVPALDAAAGAAVGMDGTAAG